MQNYKLYDILIFNKERNVEVLNRFCAVTTELEVLKQHVAEFLHPFELEYLASLQYPRRQAAYLRGRYAAKLALARLCSHIPSSAIAIHNGVFGFPYLISEHAMDAQISI